MVLQNAIFYDFFYSLISWDELFNEKIFALSTLLNKFYYFLWDDISIHLININNELYIVQTDELLREIFDAYELSIHSLDNKGTPCSQYWFNFAENTSETLQLTVDNVMNDLFFFIIFLFQQLHVFLEFLNLSFLINYFQYYFNKLVSPIIILFLNIFIYKQTFIHCVIIESFFFLIFIYLYFIKKSQIIFYLNNFFLSNFLEYQVLLKTLNIKFIKFNFIYINFLYWYIFIYKKIIYILYFLIKYFYFNYFINFQNFIIIWTPAYNRLLYYMWLY